MSHFTVLVIGSNPEEQLAPFHEFECTGKDDQYVQDIDITEETLKEFNSDTVRRYKAPNGKTHCPYGKQFYRDPTEEEKPKVGRGMGFGNDIRWDSRDWGDGKGYRAKIPFIPEGWEEVEVPVKDVFTLSEWFNDWKGIKTATADTLDLEDEHKYGYALLDGSGNVVKVINRTNPDSKWDWYLLGGRWTGFFKIRDGATASTGSPGLMTSEAPPGHADSALKGDIDMTELPVTFAVIKDGKWYERGSMGWWGIVSDEKDAGDWEAKFRELVDSLPDDTLLSVYDCHI